MKIIVLQDFLRSGGTERHAVLLAREFADRDPRQARVAYESLLMLLRGLALTSTLRDDPVLADDILELWLTRVLHPA